MHTIVIWLFSNHKPLKVSNELKLQNTLYLSSQLSIRTKKKNKNRIKDFGKMMKSSFPYDLLSVVVRGGSETEREIEEYKMKWKRDRMSEDRSATNSADSQIFLVLES